MDAMSRIITIGNIGNRLGKNEVACAKKKAIDPKRIPIVQPTGMK